MKKHQINLITAEATAKQKHFGYNPPSLAKKYVNGIKQKSSFPKYWSQKIVGWNNLKELSKILTPYIEGDAPKSEYTAICYGEFEPNLKEPDGYRRLKANMIDTPHQYFILDIETDAPEYGDICLDLNKVHQWLIEKYDFVKEDTGMFLHFSGSAGVVTRDRKHHQIRVRAIMEHTCVHGLKEDARKNILRNYMKVEAPDFDNHIDSGSHEMSRIFFTAPPFLDRTKQVLDSEMSLLVEGNPIVYDDIRILDSLWQKPSEGGNVASSDITTPSSLNFRQDIKKKTTQEHFDAIGDKNRYRGQYYCLLSAWLKEEDVEYWKQKIIKDPNKLGDWTDEELDSRVQYIKENYHVEFDKPTDLIQHHNVTDIEEYLLKDWDDQIYWKDKGVILQKLYEGSGKTQSLRELIKKFPDKSILYIAPNTKPIVEACRDLELSNYQDLGKDVADLNSNNEPVHKKLGICYPSLKYMVKEIDDDDFWTPKGLLNLKTGLQWEIVVMDEIEQLLVFGVDTGGCVNDPEMNNGILRQLVEQAELVVGMDARISNLTLQALEHWRQENIFDIYTQSKVKPFKDHHFTFVNSTENAVNYIREAVNKGKRVAVVSELDRSGRKANLESLKKYIEQETGKMGWAVDRDNKDEEESTKYINEIGYLEGKLKDDSISHIWLSPVLMSAWSYLSEEAPFDLVVGLYPNSVLTAPNIIQHIKRFRTSKNFVMYINQHHRYRPHEIYKKMYPPQDITKEQSDSLGELNVRHKLNDHWDAVMMSNRFAHFVEIISQRGADYEIDGTVITDEFKELNQFIQEEKQRITQAFLNPGTLNRWKKMKQAIETPHDL